MLLGLYGTTKPAEYQVTLRWFSRDLNSRGTLVANALSDSITDAVMSTKTARLRPLFDRAAQDERLFALGLCGLDGQLIQSTERFPDSLSCARATELAAQAEPRLALSGGAVHVGVQDIMGSRPLAPAAQGIADEPAAVRWGLAAARDAASAPDTAEPGPRVMMARLVLLHDLSFIERRSQDTRRYLIGLIAALGLVIALITVVVAQLSWRPSRQTCAPACATSRMSTGDRPVRKPSGRPSVCAPCCAPS